MGNGLGNTYNSLLDNVTVPNFVQIMLVLEHFPKEDLKKFLEQMGRKYVYFLPHLMSFIYVYYTASFQLTH